MNLIIELKRNQQTKCEPITTYMGRYAITKGSGKNITHDPIIKGQHQRHVTTKPCKETHNRLELCVEKLYFSQ